MLISGIFSFIGDSIMDALIGLFLLIDSLIYTIIGWLYQLFIIISSYRFFDNSIFTKITRSIYIVLGVVILFIIAYHLLQAMIKADDNKAIGDAKKTIITVITSLALVALVPTIFDFAFGFQNAVLMNNTLGKIFLPDSYLKPEDSVTYTYNSSGNDENTVSSTVDLKVSIDDVSEEEYSFATLKSEGYSMATQIFQAFFYPTNATYKNFDEASENVIRKARVDWTSMIISGVACAASVAGGLACAGVTAGACAPVSLVLVSGGCAVASIYAVDQNIVQNIDIINDSYSLRTAYLKASYDGDFNVFQSFSGLVANGEITYHYILSSICGIFVVVVLASFCIDLALRTVKLAFYQIIAPIPIMLRIIPKQEKVFSNWLKAVLSTYAEVFIRMIILYFAVFLISNIPSIMNQVFMSNQNYFDNNIIIYFLVRIVIIVGIILFAKQLPQIIKDITGLDSGKFNVLSGIKGAMQAGSMFGAAVTAGANNFMAKENPDGSKRGLFNRFRSAVGGVGSGLAHGYKGMDNAKDWNSTKKAAHDASQEAIKKRIQRQNDKYNKDREKQAYLDKLNEDRVNKGKDPIKYSGSAVYKAHKIGESVKEWAGATEFNSMAVARIQEMADKVDSGFSTAEGTWKKSQPFIDAKSEAEKAKQEEKFAREEYARLYQDAYNNILRDRKIDVNDPKQAKSVEAAKQLAAKRANIELTRITGSDLQTAINKARQTKSVQDSQERSEIQKKAEVIAQSLRNIQQTASQYSDVKVDMERVFNRETDPNKRQKLIDAYKKYGELSVEDNFAHLVRDLQSTDDKDYADAHSLIDFFDKYNLEMKSQKADAIFKEQQHKSTFTKSKDGESK